MRNLISSLIFIFYAFSCIIQRNDATGGVPSEDPNALAAGATVVHEDVKNQQSSDLETSENPLAIVLHQGAENQLPSDLETSEIPLDEINTPFNVVRVWNRETRSYDYNLPSIMKKRRGKKELTVIDGQDPEKIQLCPKITFDDDSGLINAVYAANPATKSCLFTTTFQSYEAEKCTEKPAPWLRKMQENMQQSTSPIKTNCGEQKDHHLLVFEYNDCDSEDTILSYGQYVVKEILTTGHENNINPFKFRATYPMYEICYDFHEKKTLWTRNQVLEPMLMYDPEIPPDVEDYINLETMNTSTFDLHLPDNAFENLKKIYLSKEINMNAEYLVPPKHFALLNWKTSTGHLINTGPLQEKFHKLMHAINEGLIKASVRMFSQTGKKLHIFTKAETLINKYTFLPIFGTPEERFAENIWYKFVYNEYDKSSALITLYNYENVPLKRKCENTLACNFKKWSTKKIEISENILNFVSCCAISQEYAKQLFQVDVIVEATFDINRAVLNFDETDTKLSYLEGNSKDSLALVPQTKLGDLSLEEARPEPDFPESNLSIIPIDTLTAEKRVEAESQEHNEKSIVPFQF